MERIRAEAMQSANAAYGQGFVLACREPRDFWMGHGWVFLVGRGGRVIGAYSLVSFGFG